MKCVKAANVSLNGLEAPRRMTGPSSGTKVIILSQYDIDEYKQAAAESGARDYVVKKSMMHRLIPAIRAAVSETPREDAGRTEIMTIPMTEWLKLCFSKSVARRALSTALIVGIVLTAINYGDAILQGMVTPAQWIRMMLTFCVPYCVSTYSSVRAILEMKSNLKKRILKRTKIRVSGELYGNPYKDSPFGGRIEKGEKKCRRPKNEARTADKTGGT
jgi:hypothetical protein